MRKVAIGVGILVVALLGFYLFSLRTKPLWNGSSRLRTVVGNETGETVFVLFDPQRSEVRTYAVNKEVKVETAFGLGSWKVGSLWKLGEQEGKGGGKMLSQSLIRGYGVPVEGYLYYKGAVESFSLARSLLFARETNISLVDRIRLAWFTLRAKVEPQEELTQTSIILTGEELQKLTDGIVTVSEPKDFQESQLKALSLVASNLGGKVLDVSTIQEENSLYCSVEGNSLYAQKLSRVFNCAYVQSDNQGVHLTLSSKFAKEF